MQAVSNPGSPQAQAVGEPAQPAAPSDSAQTQALTQKEEAFCIALAESGNRSFAYRRAYKPAVNTKPATIWSAASEISQRPHVQARMKTLLEDAASKSVASKARIIDLLWQRIWADRREVINHVRRCCRYCYGTNHKYQWKDALEYLTAAAQIMEDNGKVAPEKRKPLLDVTTDPPGGYGFDPHREPELTCDSDDCLGDGLGKTVVTDTTKLTGAAALIYEGVKETKDGLQILLADRSADIVLLAKLLGWSVEKVEGAAGSSSRAGLPDAAYDIPSTASPEEASRRYLSFVS